MENSGPDDVPVRTGMNGWRRSRPTVKHAATTKTRRRKCRQGGFETNDEDETDLLLGVVERSKLLLRASFMHDEK